MKIDSVELENFQSHEKTIVDFDHGFNVVVGKTNHGKTSILRHLRFALFDYWNKRYIRTGTKNTKITITFDSGDKLVRTKGEKNEAIFISSTGEETKFESFGDTLPLKIKELLKIPDFKIDTDKEIIVNIASQQDPLFLISPQAYSAPLVSKFFSRLSGIHILDSANRNVDKDKKNKMEVVKSLDDLITKDTAILKDLEKVFEWKKIIDSKIEESKTIEAKVKQLDDLNMLLNKVKIFNDKRKNLESLENEIKKIDLESINKFLSTSRQFINYTELQDRVVKVKNQIASLNPRLESQQIDLKILEDEKKEFFSGLKMCPFCGHTIENSDQLCSI